MLVINKQLLKRRFSKRADTYDEFATVQKKMADKLLSLLQKELPTEQPLRILEIGSGTGYVTKALLASFPEANITAIELAEGMITKAKQEIASQRVQFICADIESYSLQDTYDVVISNTCFQWLNEPQQTLQRLRQNLKPNGMLLFSTFGINTFQELHRAHATVTNDLECQSKPLGQSFPTLQALTTLSVSASPKAPALAKVIAKEDIHVEYFPTVRDFLHAIQRIGATNSNAIRDPRSPGFFRKLFAAYEAQDATAKGIPATYHCLYILLRQAQDETEIDVAT